jgi:beta-galactosidase
MATQPQSQTKTVGTTATFNVAVNGTAPFLYFWYKNGVQISGANSSSYTTPSLTNADNGNTYYCIITNCSNLSQVTSSTATLSINTPCAAVSMATQPQNQPQTAGTTATFSVAVNGTAPFLYFWYKNDTQISGTNSSSYITPTLTASDNGNTYYCIITNCNNTYQIITKTATLNVNNACVGVTISAQPKNQSANTGSTATFIVSANGTPPFVYRWYKNGVQISGANSSSYTTPTLAASDNGNTYYCKIFNCNSANQVLSDNVTLTLATGCIGVTINNTLSSQSAIVGEKVTWTVSTSGTAPFNYQWYKNSSLISGQTNSSYTTPSLTLSDNSNTYYCYVTNCSNSKNSKSNTATLSSHSKQCKCNFF